MTNRDLAEKIYEDLNKKGADLGNASIGIIRKTLDDNAVKNCSIPVVSNRRELLIADMKTIIKNLEKQLIKIYIMKKGTKITYTKEGVFGFEDINEAEQGGLIIGQTVTINEFCKKDNAVKVNESYCDTWISLKHFTCDVCYTETSNKKDDEDYRYCDSCNEL